MERKRKRRSRAELSGRRGIDLIYTISENLPYDSAGEAASRILRKCRPSFFRARRATLLVHDRARMCCGSSPPRGVELGEMGTDRMDDPSRRGPVFREMRIISYDPTTARPGAAESISAATAACLSFGPRRLRSPGRVPTPDRRHQSDDRTGEDAFTARRRKLAAASPIRSARDRDCSTVERDLGQQRLRRDWSSRTTCSSSCCRRPRRGVEKGDVGRAAVRQSVGGTSIIFSLHGERIG